MRLLYLHRKKWRIKETHEFSKYAQSNYDLEMGYQWTMPRWFLIASISSDTARWGCRNFKSVHMEGHVLGELERAGSVLSIGRW